MKVRIVPRPATAATELVVPPSRVNVRGRSPRVLDFDIENRPLTYLGSDFTTGEVTAIAWAWTDRPAAVTVRLLGETDLPEILAEFLKAYQQADMVTGHFIRGHDLPMINGALMELRLPALPDKVTSDTKLDAMRTKGISLSQESLAAMWRLERQKQSMNQGQWRAANRLTPEGLAEVRRRVVGDVQQHIELRAEMVRLGYLCAPRIWKSGSARAEAYAP